MRSAASDSLEVLEKLVVCPSSSTVLGRLSGFGEGLLPSLCCSRLTAARCLCSPGPLLTDLLYGGNCPLQLLSSPRGSADPTDISSQTSVLELFSALPLLSAALQHKSLVLLASGFGSLPGAGRLQKCWLVRLYRRERTVALKVLF